MPELRTETFTEGSIIFQEGDRPEVPCMYDILSGRVGIYLNYGTPREKQLAILTVMDPATDTRFFGEMSLLDGAPRSATAVALETCRLSVITRKTLQQYLNERPAFVMAILKQMSGRLRSLTDQYMDACHVIARQEAAGADHEKDHALSEQIRKYSDLWNGVMAESNEAAIYAHQYGLNAWDSVWLGQWCRQKGSHLYE